jgi:hypothetical protein
MISALVFIHGPLQGDGCELLAREDEPGHFVQHQLIGIRIHNPFGDDRGSDVVHFHRLEVHLLE